MNRCLLELGTAAASRAPTTVLDELKQFMSPDAHPLVPIPDAGWFVADAYGADWVPMYDEQRSWLMRNPSPFSEADRSAFAEQPQNEQGIGDQACLVLQRG